MLHGVRNQDILLVTNKCTLLLTTPQMRLLLQMVAISPGSQDLVDHFLSDKQVSVYNNLPLHTQKKSTSVFNHLNPYINQYSSYTHNHPATLISNYLNATRPVCDAISSLPSSSQPSYVLNKLAAVAPLYGVGVTSLYKLPDTSRT